MNATTPIDPASESSLEDRLVCKPTSWFFWRVVLMLVMFSVFAVLFLKDGIWGYREKNLKFFVHEGFNQAGTEFQRLQQEGKIAKSDWEKFAAAQTCRFPDEAEFILPRGTVLPMPWPEVLVNGYAVMKKEGGQNGANDLWEEYTRQMDWEIKTAEHPMEKHKITEQFFATGVVGILILGALFILIRTMRRTIEADGEALYTQDGRRILYSDMTKIDKRKWDIKGLALIYYQEGGEEKKAKIDGMVYGQFKEVDGQPAERLFERVMENFKGEVLEYVAHDDDEEEENN